MKKSMLLLVALGAGVVLADVSVLDVKCTPRSPWNGLVDISYTIACDDPDADVYVNPVAYDGDRRITLFPSAFTGDGATNTVKAGRHTLVWDAKKDFGAFSSSHFQFKIYAGKRLPRYAWIDLSSGVDSTNYPVHYSVVGPDVSKDDCRTTQLWLRLVPPGEFWMGSPEREFGRYTNEVLHHVTFTKPFYIGVFEVTQRQWDLVKNVNEYTRPIFWRTENSPKRPRENVYYSTSSSGDYSMSVMGGSDPTSHYGVCGDSFLSRLRVRTRVGGFNLPTEAQWEYACRAGTMTSINNGKNLADEIGSQALGEVAAYYNNCYSGRQYASDSVEVGTQTVGSYAPNALGLYDMLGNVAEMCRDGAYADIGSDDVVDPPAAGFGKGDKASLICVRGGSWYSRAGSCRSAYRWECTARTSSYMWIGFRVFCADGL